MLERCNDCGRAIGPSETAYLVDEQVCCAQCQLKRELALPGASFCTKCHRLIALSETAYLEEAELVLCAGCAPQAPHDKAHEIGSGWMGLDESEATSEAPPESRKPRTSDSGHPLLHLLRIQAD
jgi:hypothetical protein